MNPSKVEEDIFQLGGGRHNHSLGPPSLALPQLDPPEPDPPFLLPEVDLFRSSDSDSLSPSSENDAEADSAARLVSIPDPSFNSNPRNSEKQSYISPEPHLSSQFYTFNAESHSLMIRCLLEGRLATASEVRAVTPKAVLDSWRSVWKDRSEDTAYLTAWKRLQEKLSIHVDSSSGNRFLCFKNNTNQFVSHINQWQDIVMSFHGETDLKHLGLKETIDRIKQMWTVGAKFYGIPESFIRVCVASCPVCNTESPGSAIRSKRRRFEYTESFDVPAKEVPAKLQQLAKKYKVVLCIRQKYIRYKPFMAEVKDYACHRAGDPAASAKRSRILKREPYVSKRCGCGFRIRAIVPIANYNEKEKTFVYQEEGIAVFKLYAVHSGHQPGPLDGNARIMHRIVGHKNGLLMDQDTVYGVSEEMDSERFALMSKDDGDMQLSVLQQVHKLRAELGILEGRIAKMPMELLSGVSQELLEVINRVRRIDEECSKSVGLLSDKAHDVLMCENDLSHWSNHHSEQMYGDGNHTDLIEDDDDSFGRSLGDVVPWEPIRIECRSQKDLIAGSCKPEKWLKCGDFDEKVILDCEDSKLTKGLRHDGGIVEDEHESLEGIQVENFYPENPKWYDSPCGLDPGTDCGDVEFRHNLSI
ncbi:hypothetical protein SAY87_000723 [Trapa incisa]|uniref:Uncharacterized protein n=1 Tax=Trapa incisa TaxID=236973 RepID=A0AAN7GU25_9MYRT|nr:hypothetical protein SAY87_000723 [Trapa incisa]